MPSIVVPAEAALDESPKIVIAADQVTIGRDEHVGADAHMAAKNLAVEADVRALAQLDIPFLHDRIVLRPMNTPSRCEYRRWTHPGVDSAVVIDERFAVRILCG